MIDRRSFMALTLPWTVLALAGWGSSGAGAQQTDGRYFGPPEPFDFGLLRDRAAAMAKNDHVPRRSPAGDVIRRIDFDAVQKIRFRPDHTLWQDGPGAYPVRFFHLHTFVPEPVRINVVSDGMAREYLYSTDHFDYADTGLDAQLPKELGYAGFRVMADGEGKTDWLAFQGASYFRTSGEEDQYGASARGIAVNTGLDAPEEFPAFTEFWLEPAAPGDEAVVVHALLDGPSVTGAFRFQCERHNGVTMDVQSELFVRSDIRRLGIAPLTSMYWYGENDRRLADDWRPEIHDSDGLALWTGSGERLFRPLINPPVLQVNSFFDRTPKGFGLVQHDRDFANYQDDGAFYERRPSIWVEPLGDWGEGAVQLVEIPTDGEILDNIVAYWQPRSPARKGDRLAFDYRLHWRNREPYPPEKIAQVVATRTGRGGRPGETPVPGSTRRKFVIDFEGGAISEMEARYDLTPVVTASRGTVSDRYAVRIVGTKRWRAVFDLEAAGPEPVDLRCFLQLENRTLTETWLYQYFPQT
ncbi:MAG: glucan biosynthesis protein D [Rhodospirillaceae bacterium]